jgi:hypothetical protein
VLGDKNARTASIFENNVALVFVQGIFKSPKGTTDDGKITNMAA